MSKPILHTECQLYLFHEKTIYSSRQVAEEFQKRHTHVLRSIDEIAEPKIGLSEEGELAGMKRQPSLPFIQENFFEHKYKDASGKMSREVLMTRNGSSILVMGFTGAKALHFKISLMNRFDQMEQFILALSKARLEHPAFTQAIMEAHEKPKHYHFSNEADMINRIVLGVTAKQFREANEIGKGESIRPYLNTEQIQAIEMLQRVDIGLLVATAEYEERKQMLAQYYVRTKRKQIA